METNTIIRPWLIACGQQFGITEAFEYRWSDENTRPITKFCTYEIVSMETTDASTIDMSSKSSYSATVSGSKQYMTTVKIDLYNSPNGMYELAALCIGAEKQQAIINLFNQQNCAFVECLSIENNTDYDQNKINYQMTARVVFSERVKHSMSLDNEVVTSILTNVIIHPIDD